jgi:polyhydroxybutyrate depolymerase
MLRRCSRWVGLALALAAPLPAAEATRQELKSLTQRGFSHEGLTRQALQWRPHPLGPAGLGRVPLVLVLHGGGGTAVGMARLSGFTGLAQSKGFAVIFPDSGVQAWNDGRPDPSSHRPSTDDAGWLTALAQDAVREGWADPKRLYVCGMSNGGFMALRLACEQPAVFAAVGSVAANGAGAGCPHGDPVPLCLIAGTDDPIVPFRGGPIRWRQWGGARGLAEPFAGAVSYWSRRDQAGPEAVPQELPDLDPKDGTRVRLLQWPARIGGADLQAYVVEGGGHAWPGGWAYMGRFFIGRTSRDLDATVALWDFFKAHPKP